MAGEMWVRVAKRPIAEEACRMVFGPDVLKGPLLATPAALLKLLPDWPLPHDGVHRVALELPVDFDIEKEMGRKERKAVVLDAHRLAIYCGPVRVGHSIRTDQLGINALQTYWETVEAHRRRLRQAH